MQASQEERIEHEYIREGPAAMTHEFHRLLQSYDDESLATTLGV
jgi:hypothetical protein